MTKFHAVMKDETGCEFGVDVEAENKQQALDNLSENYPESRCVQLEDDNDAEQRQDAMWERIRREEEDGYYYEDEYD